jgi:hypothetical protein
MADLSNLVSTSTGIVSASSLEKGSTFSIMLLGPGDQIADMLKISENANAPAIQIGSTFPVRIDGQNFTGVVRGMAANGEIMIDLID